MPETREQPRLCSWCDNPHCDRRYQHNVRVSETRFHQPTIAPSPLLRLDRRQP